MNPLVSIIIPTYNRAEDLKRALQSVFDQTFTDWEVLVVDNHSIDETDSLIKSFSDPKIKLFKIHNAGVIAASRNLGLKHALGEYIAFLDSDDWWDCTKLENISNNFDDKIDILYHDCFIVTNSSKRLTKSRILKGDVLHDLIENGNALVNSSVVVKKQSLHEVGCFSEEKEVVGWEDYHLWLKLAENSCIFKYKARSSSSNSAVTGFSIFEYESRLCYYSW